MNRPGYSLRPVAIPSASSLPSDVARPSGHSRRLMTALFLGITCVPAMQAQQSAFANYLPTITTIAGTPGTPGTTGDGGPATAAKLQNPGSVGWDAAGNLYIDDKSKSTIREVFASNGNIQTIIGNATAGYIDGVTGTAAEIDVANAIAVDAAGNVYLADTKNNRIRKWTNSTAIINTIAGNGSTTFGGDGASALNAGISGPDAVAVDAYGNIYFSDTGHDVVRVIYEGGPVSAVPGLAAAATAFTPPVPQVGYIYTIAGIANNAAGTGDGGLATIASISGPGYNSLDAHNNLYFAGKTTNGTIRQVIADTDIINTIAGNGTLGSTGDGGPATSAEFSSPNATKQDMLGNVFIVDDMNNAIRVVDPQTQKIYTIAGQIGVTGTATTDGDGGPSTAGSLSAPLDIAFSNTGVLAIADSVLRTIRAVTPPVTSFPATSVASASTAASYTLGAVKSDTFSSIAIQQTASDFTLASTGCTVPASVTAGVTSCLPTVKFTPSAPGLRVSQLVTTDTSGDKAILQLTGVGNASAVSITPGIISTIAGTPGTTASTGDGGAATSADLNKPAGITLDSAGNLYIAGADNKVRVVSPSGAINTFAGTGTAGFSGDYGPASAALLSNPTAVTMAPNGDIYIADTGNNMIRMVGAESGVIRSVTVPGMLSTPKGIAFDITGNLYIADTGNSVIREVNRYTNFYTVLAGTAGTTGKTGDSGAATSALLSGPTGIAFDAAGNIYIADTGNSEVRKITVATGIITTVAGNGSQGSTGDGGLATSATLNAPSQIAVDAAGNIYIACAGSSSVRMVSAATGNISTVAGTGTASTGGDGGLATSGSLSSPLSLTLDGKDDLYIADTNNSRVAEVPGTTTKLTFPTTNTGKTSAAQTVTVTNFGNQSLTFSALSITTPYTQTVSGGTDCSSKTTLTVGASCLVSVAFAPSTGGTITGTLTLTDNALGVSTATQMISLTGVGNLVQVIPSSVSVTGGNNQTTVPYSAFAAPLQVTVLDQNGSGAANAAVTFTAPSTGATGTFSNGTNTITVQSGGGGVTSVPFTAGGTRGTFGVTATVPGVSTPATFSETIAGNPTPSISFSYAPTTNPVTYGETLTLSATLKPPTGATTPVGGTVTFSDNGTTVQTVTVTNGVATYAYVPSAGSHSYTAAYSGDANYSATSYTTPLTLTVIPLTITATANSVTFAFGTLSLPTLTGKLNGVLPADASNVTLALSTSPAYSNVLPVGMYNISGSISGTAAANYQLTSTTGTVTVTAAPVSIVLATSNSSPGTATQVVFTATVTSLVTGSTLSTTTADPAATVTFYDGATSIGSAKNAATGIATLNYTFATLGTHTISAVVTPGNYGPNTSNAVTEVVSAPALTLSTNSSTYTVVQGQKADVMLTTIAVGGITTTVTFSCSGLPANTSCVITPLTFTPTATVNGTVTDVQIDTAGPGVLHTNNTPPMLRGNTSRIAVAGIAVLPAFVLLGLLTRKRRRSRYMLGLQIVVVLLFGTALLQTTGCGGGTITNPASAVYTPVGSSTVTITASAGTLTGSTSITLNVTAAP